MVDIGLGRMSLKQDGYIKYVHFADTVPPLGIVFPSLCLSRAKNLTAAHRRAVRVVLLMVGLSASAWATCMVCMRCARM